MAVREELLDATDETIEEAVQYADPMVLRGLLYQLTGDEAVASTEVVTTIVGFGEIKALANPSDRELLCEKAAEFLKGLRDRGVTDPSVGPPERLPKSLGLSAGEEI